MHTHGESQLAAETAARTHTLRQAEKAVVHTHSERQPSPEAAARTLAGKVVPGLPAVTAGHV